MFHQVEALAVGENITMADLKGVLTYFAKAMFGAERKVRLRPSYFPLPSPAQKSISNAFCAMAAAAPCASSRAGLRFLVLG